MSLRHRLLPLLLLAASATPSLAAHPFFDLQAAASNGSGLVTQIEGGTSFDQDRYRIAARARTARLGADAPGTREQYSASLTRELYFVTVSGRLGTSPPSPQSAGYHLASGEAWFKFYGGTLAPEHPELSPVIWESSGPVPDPDSLDRTWITRVGGVYTNINNHIRTPGGLFILVQGSWQFSVLETYRETTTFGVQGGGNRFNKMVDGTSPVILQNVVDYWGNFMPVTGWANSWQSLRVEHVLGPATLSLSGTRLNRLAGRARTMAAAEVSWKARRLWTWRLGLERFQDEGARPRRAIASGLSFQW